MNLRLPRLVGCAIAVCLILASCDQAEIGLFSKSTTPSPGPVSIDATSAIPSATASPTATKVDTPTLTPSPSATPSIFNPLTGLPVQNPQTLDVAPIMISITEFPPSARPQAGLSLAAQVWETYIGQGMSRFLAVYYGDYLAAFKRVLAAHPRQSGYGFAVGPIRSGRVGWETIKAFYPDALLVTRYASPEVASQLTNLVVVYARDPQDVNSAGLTLSELKDLSPAPIRADDVGGLDFNMRAPDGGNPASTLRIFYNLFDQIEWVWDPTRSEYLRYQDKVDGTGVVYPLADRLTNETIGADNVVVLFADHDYDNPAGTILQIDLMYKDRQRGLLFRDGKQYDIQWSTLRLHLGIQDEQGNPMPLKPGRTFFEIVSIGTRWDPQAMRLRFYNPPAPTPVPSITPKPTKEATEPAQTPAPASVRDP